MERVYTISELAGEKLGNPKLYYTIRRWFQNEPGVINGGTGKRNQFLLVPESVAERVIKKRMNRGQS
jgi:hypothetical protein